MPNYGLWAKMFGVGAAMCIGGPALVMWISPTEEELFQRYNPELQKRSLENRQKNQEEFDHFVTRLKEYSKSEKPIWDVAEEDRARTRADLLESQRLSAEQVARQKEEIRRASGS
ncbi:assembly factor cbp-4 [Xylona heveae TC161]|uniref:Cytochrome b mRNA-processing protein 4 n=1 Tax=Xylona heveae (strain CBS 132557 / TC161) TaxID=1328760 RepID=A0A165FCX5_XYLHT|nr:assembly factor cbp-4 [Xylona heveae TC161]KZF20835.1 assembly factor cbp-4 [Xylona heveae TC161]